MNLQRTANRTLTARRCTGLNFRREKTVLPQERERGPERKPHVTVDPHAKRFHTTSQERRRHASNQIHKSQNGDTPTQAPRPRRSHQSTCPHAYLQPTSIQAAGREMTRPPKNTQKLTEHTSTPKLKPEHVACQEATVPARCTADTKNKRTTGRRQNNTTSKGDQRGSHEKAHSRVQFTKYLLAQSEATLRQHPPQNSLRVSPHAGAADAKGYCQAGAEGDQASLANQATTDRRAGAQPPQRGLDDEWAEARPRISDTGSSVKACGA